VEEDGIHIGSRNNDVTDGTFRGATQYIREHKGICEYLSQNPDTRLY